MKIMQRGMAIVSFAIFILFLSSGAVADTVPRGEHPRPDLMREAWQSLNGEWEFAYDAENKGESERWYERKELSQKITVPFEIESSLSGIGRENPPEVVWYLRSFTPEPKIQGQRVLLHFEAVDYQAKVWLNGQLLGEHTGGYTPFTFEITDKLKPGENVIAVRVFDSRSKAQVRGKQTTKDHGYSIWYTAVTGIWQPVWLERVGRTYIERVEMYPSLSPAAVRIKALVNGPVDGLKLAVSISDEGKNNFRREVDLSNGCEMTIDIPQARAWSPEDPFLYKTKIAIQRAGSVVDEAEGYLGLRTIKTGAGQVLLNGQPFYQKLVLAQGYYPPGIYSPQSDENFKKDVELIKAMGFNGLRLHQKIECQRFYYWCDVLGLVVWEEMPSMFLLGRRDLAAPAHDQFRRELDESMERDFNHPSIIVHTLFNESWGITRNPANKAVLEWVDEMTAHARTKDPTRLVVDNSGWLHQDTDILDVHHYLPTVEKSYKLYDQIKPENLDKLSFAWSLLGLLRAAPVLPPLMPGYHYRGQPIVISEYGGFGFYTTEKKSLLDNYRAYTEAIGKYPYIVGYCYTQPYDVEQERNGLLTEDRKPKEPLAEIKAINDKI